MVMGPPTFEVKCASNHSGKITPGEAELLCRQFLSELPPSFHAVPLLPRPLKVAKRLLGYRLQPHLVFFDHPSYSSGLRP
jgi:hypothetical protein